MYAIVLILAIFLILFLPGYAISWAIFPKKKDLDVVERIVLSFALSVAIFPIVMFYLNRVGNVAINIWSVLIVIGILTASGFVIWKWRNKKGKK